MQIDQTGVHDGPIIVGGKAKEVKLINQGAYGCIFYPGINCKGKLESSRFVTKIQKNDKTVKNEIYISKRIMQIRGYFRYYSPIIKTCPVKITKKLRSEMQQCNVVKEKSGDDARVNLDNLDIVSNKVAYVGANNLRKHLLRKHVPRYASYGDDPSNRQNKPQNNLPEAQRFVAELLRTQLYLNRGIEQLIKHKIVHYDIRYNNIMYSEKLETPVIIDFGLSISIADLSPTTYHRKFYVFDIYPYWCMDIYICSYIFQTITYPIAESKTITRAEIDYIVDSFIYKEDPDHIGSIRVANDVFNIGVIGNQIDAFIAKWKAFLSPFVGKPWFGLYKELIKSWPTWDNYSLCVVYLMTLDDLFANNLDLYKIMYANLKGPIEKYTEILTRVIYSPANERPSLAATSAVLREIDELLRLG